MSEWNGARWWKCDFHSHTPASNDYGKGPDQESLRDISPRQWLLNYMQVGVDCVVVTDHNSGAWINDLKAELEELEAERPEEYRPLYVFPGVEISVHGGVHLLAILDRDKKTSDIDSLLGAVGFPSDAKGSSSQVTTKSFLEVVQAITAVGGLAIPAHVDRCNGLLRLQGTTLGQILDCKNIFAIELIDTAFEKPQLYVEKGLHWTEILGSDAHHPSGVSGQQYPGSHYTWVKMGTPGLEGLRLALLDGALSVSRSDSDVEDPNAHSSLTLDSVEINRARYMGRSQSFNIGFNPWFNAIIGGRGTGKSTAVEFLRIALRRTEELPEVLQDEFKQYGQVYMDREDSGLLTSDAAIRVIYRKDRDRFLIQWNPSGNLDPIKIEKNGMWQHADGDIQQRFPVRIYSQKQVFQLARMPHALLKIINDAPDVGFQTWTEEWKKEESSFLSLRARAREIEAGLDEEQRLRGELDDVKRKLAIYEQSGHADVLKTYQLKKRQQRDVEVWEDDWTSTGEQLRGIAAGIVPDRLEENNFDSTEPSDIEFHRLSERIRERMNEIRKSLEALADHADEVVEAWRRDRNDSAWYKNVEEAIDAYRKSRESLDKEDAGDLEDYGSFVQRRQEIEQRLKVLDENKVQVGELRSQAKLRLDRLLAIRQELTASRRSFLATVLQGNTFVRIQVVPYGDRETVEGEFRRLIQKEDGSFGNDIGMPDGGGLLGALYESAGAELFEQNLMKTKNYIKNIASGDENGTDLADQRFANHVRKLPPEVFDRLDLWFPEDSLKVEYSAGGDGRQFRSIQEGSPGQKTAALLAFLLSYGDEPLILDQPEDDLDNHLIYDLIVTQLREVKRSRQVIVVTHNANIVVNGDAELVVALNARGGETQKECDDCLQVPMVRETICEVMEGGRTAFEDRYRRIALEGRHV